MPTRPHRHYLIDEELSRIDWSRVHAWLSTVMWLLATLDAHGVYSPLGFRPLDEIERWMVRRPVAAGAPPAAKNG